MADIKFDTHNYRNHSEKNLKLIKKSLDRNGAGRSVLLDSENELIAGNGVYSQAKALGIPVRVIETDGSELIAVKRTDLKTQDRKRKELALMDNSTSDNVTWDIDNISSDFDLDELTELGVELDEADEKSLAEQQGEIIEDEEPIAGEVPTRSKSGDIWKLGDHRLICGDVTDAKTLEKLLDGATIDLLVTDPPYNVDYVGKTADALKIKNDKMDNSQFLGFLDEAFFNIFSHIKKGGSFYIFHADQYRTIFQKAVENNGGLVKQCLEWVKNVFVMGRQDYQWRHEPILYGWKDGASHYFIDDRTQDTTMEKDGKAPDFSKLTKEQAIKALEYIYSQTTVIAEHKPARNAEHPTMKPVAILAKFVRNSSRLAENVLDPFGGSGSTLIACEQLGRKCFTSEIDPQYADVIIARWERFTGLTAEKITGDDHNGRK